MKVAFLIWAYASILLGCSREPAPIEHKAYRVMDIGKPGVPMLSKKQLDWVHKIERSPIYSKLIGDLYFSPEPAFTKPLIVVSGDPSANLGGSWVIGDPCNAMYWEKEGEHPIPEDNYCGPQP